MHLLIKVLATPRGSLAIVLVAIEASLVNAGRVDFEVDVVALVGSRGFIHAIPAIRAKDVRARLGLAFRNKFIDARDFAMLVKRGQCGLQSLCHGLVCIIHHGQALETPLS